MYNVQRLRSDIFHFDIQKYILVNICFREVVYNLPQLETSNDLHVHERMSLLGNLDGIQQLINSWNRVCINVGDIIQLPVVHTHLLLDTPCPNKGVGQDPGSSLGPVL